MNITDVQVVLVNHDERLKAYVTITIESCFVVRDLKVIAGVDGLFVAMPAKKMKDGSFKDIAHPVNQSTREEIESRVLKAYQDVIKSSRDDRKLKAI